MTNYTIIQNETITSYLSDKGFRLYTLLKSMCYGEKNTCYPSQKYLATALRCSVKTIQRALQELISFNLIVKRRRGSISNLYILVQKKINNAVDRLKQATGNKADKQSLSSRTKNNYNNKVKTDKFNDYDQRNYDFDKLENLLLNKKGNLSECQILRSDIPVRKK